MNKTDNKAKVLLVDDDSKLLRLTAIGLARAGYETHCARDGEEALVAFSRIRPDLVITDVRMERLDGMLLFDILHEREPTLPVIILTAHGSIRDAVDATQRGVFAYMTKPFDGEELIENVSKALRLVRATNPPGADERHDAWGEDIVTVSSSMKRLLAESWKIARSDSNVLLLGDSGTGKELLARAIHKASRRREGPFIAVNCMAVPEQLVEAEFFGHRRGAFTGAIEHRQGLMQAATTGTLLLDEVGDMPLSFQGKLLRALQEQEVRPVGATQEVPIDVRVIAASHKNLEAAVEQRSFREDLYYRLCGVTLEVPPLSARREDIPLLAEHFLAGALAKDEITAARGFSPDAMELLVSAAWPGNVRQLKNVVEQCVILATSALISAELVGRALRAKVRKHVPLTEARDRFELEYLVQLLKTTHGNVAQAARLAERNRSEFYTLLKKHNLDPEVFRVDSTSLSSTHDSPN